jgi:hypothetical protein
MGMTTQKPIDTNCGSAPKSTGTASPEGKTASRVNALELEALAAGCHDSFEPARAHQLFLIDSHRCRLAIPPSRRSRDAAGTRSPVPKDSFRGLEDGLLDEVFDSLDTFTRLEQTPSVRPGALTTTALTWLLRLHVAAWPASRTPQLLQNCFRSFLTLLAVARSSAPHAGTSPGVSAIADPGLVW